MEITELLERLGKDTGLGLMALDEASTCTFLVDEMKVSFLYIPQGGNLLLFAEAGELPGEHSPALLLSVLQANYLFRGTAGATLAVRPDSKTLFLNRSLRLDAISYDDFVQALSDFTDTLAEWKRLIADYRPTASEPQTPSSDTIPAGGIPI